MYTHAAAAAAAETGASSAETVTAAATETVAIAAETAADPYTDAVDGWVNRGLAVVSSRVHRCLDWETRMSACR